MTATAGAAGKAGPRRAGTCGSRVRVWPSASASVLAVAVCVLAAIALGLGAASAGAAEACPNEQLRSESRTNRRPVSPTRSACPTVGRMRW